MASLGQRLEIRFFWTIFVKDTGLPQEIKEVFEDTIKRHTDMMARIYLGHWKPEDYPVWKTKMKATHNLWGFKWWTNTAPMPWLAEGTKIRWAIMQRGFRRKTRVRKFGSFGAGGEPVVRGKRNMTRPKKGIQARAWHYEIAKRDSGPRGLSNRLQKGIRAWVGRQWDGKRGRRLFKNSVKVRIL